MKLTSKLRRYDAGAMEIGYLVSNYQVIPPQESAFISRGYCAPQCFKDVRMCRIYICIKYLTFVRLNKIFPSYNYSFILYKSKRCKNYEKKCK